MTTQSVDLTTLEQREHALARELEELLGRRQRLALEAQHDAAAAQELDDVKLRIGAIESEQEDLALARKELEARGAAEAQAREAERRREMEAQLAELGRNRLPIAGEIEQATEALASALARLFFVGDEMVRLTHALSGQLRHRLDLRDMTLGYLKWRLPELGLGRAHSFYRRPLREILSSQAAEPSGQAPAAGQDERPAEPSQEASA